MLAHVDPSWATKAEKVEKMGRAQNTVKRGGFWRHGDVRGGSPAGGAAPLSYGEERNAFGNATARGPLAGITGYAPCRRPQGAAASGAVSGGLRVAVKGVEANTVTILLREWCESRYCKCWEYPLGYDPLRFILRFSVCCPLLSAFQNKSRKKRKSNNKGNNSTEKPEEEGEGEEGEEEEQQQEQQEGHNYWRTERASGQRPVVPNVAFCTDKKLAVFLLLPPLSPAFLLLLEDGTGLRATACSA